MKTVFITGAASGIGLLTAKLFAKHGYFVGLYDINLDGINEQLKSDDFPNACGCYCDVTDTNSISEALTHFAQHTDDKLDVLINNAGVLSSDLFTRLPAKSHDLMININVKGFTNVAYLAHQYLCQTPNSVMINLCSASSLHGIPYLAVYSATKHYVSGLSEALSIEWEPDNIRVVSIKPPVLNNRMGASVHTNLTKKMTIDLDSADVANVILEAAGNTKVSYVLSFKAVAWAFINRLLTQNARRGLVRYLSCFGK